MLTPVNRAGGLPANPELRRGESDRPDGQDDHGESVEFESLHGHLVSQENCTLCGSSVLVA